MPSTPTDASTKPTAPRRTRLALLAIDLDVPDGADAEVAAVLARVAQVFRHGVEGREGVAVGDVRSAIVPDVTADEFVAAMASLKARDV